MNPFCVEKDALVGPISLPKSVATYPPETYSQPDLAIATQQDRPSYHAFSASIGNSNSRDAIEITPRRIADAKT
jgi:hypothetical protein